MVFMEENVQITPMFDETDEPLIPEGAKVHVLQESRARGNNVPTGTIAMPYYGGADIQEYVYTNYCVKPKYGKMRLGIVGAVNSGTPGTCAVRMELYNKDTGGMVTTRTTETSGTWAKRYYSITGLSSTSNYYVRFSLVNKTQLGLSKVRVTFIYGLQDLM